LLAAPNFYQSLHTSVITEDGTPFEIQNSHRRNAQDGRGRHRAHWTYKDGPVSAQDEQRLAWLRQVVSGSGMSAIPMNSYGAESRSLSGRGLYLHAQGQVVVLPREGYAD